MSCQVTKRHGGNLKCILLSEGGQCEKAAHSMVPTIRHPGKDKVTETVERSVVDRG